MTTEQKNEMNQISSLSIDVDKAIEYMKDNKVCVFPTETFYALGSRVFSEEAAIDVFRIKRRRSNVPLPLIIASMDQLEQVASPSQDELALIEAFWPGPLSLILPARPQVPRVLLGGSSCVAVRQDSHPIACEISLALGEPLTASSANISGYESVACLSNLDCRFFRDISGIVDSEPFPKGGLPSTIAKLCGSNCVEIIRRGAVSSRNLIGKGYEVRYANP